MIQSNYKPDCLGCRLSQELDRVVGGIVQLPGDWILNHYGGEEGYLGWLALQPKYHRMDLPELTQTEAEAFGRNVQAISQLLTAYWQETWPADPLSRVYVVYFFESVFDPVPSRYHMHVHLIPRPQSFKQLLQGPCGSINAWEVHRVSKRTEFPERYAARDDSHVRPLMDWLRKHLPAPRDRGLKSTAWGQALDRAARGPSRASFPPVVRLPAVRVSACRFARAPASCTVPDGGRNTSPWARARRPRAPLPTAAMSPPVRPRENPPIHGRAMP